MSKSPQATVEIPRLIVFSIFMFTLVLSCARSVNAGPLEDASVAYKKRDYSTALALWRPLAEQGNAIAERGLGILYDNGLAVTKDSAQAVIWLTKAADQGDAEAEDRLGGMYVLGWGGLSRDRAKGFELLTKAVDQGYGASAYAIGEYYRIGMFGFPKDAVEAAAWQKKGANLEYPPSETRLGTFYEFGLGIPQDGVQANFWYKKAAEQNEKDAQQGDVAAQAGIALSYEVGGMGYVRNLRTALFWYQKAAQQDGPLKTVAEAGVERVEKAIAQQSSQ